MAHLATFFLGWLLASLLLGLAMGWIAVVHRGQGVSKRVSRWLAVLVAALIMFALYLAGCAVGSWLRDWVLSRSAPAA
jgi:predicted permease